MGSSAYATESTTTLKTADTVAIDIQVNGVTCATFDAPVDAAQETIETRAREIDAVKRQIDGKSVTVEYKANKSINFVIAAPTAV